jgi:hypothetical protein
MPVHQLQRVLEKSIALSIATKDPSAANNQALCDLKANYALQLVNQGCLGSAMKYLVFPESISADRSPRALSGALAVLKDRVYKSADPEEVRTGSQTLSCFPCQCSWSFASADWICSPYGPRRCSAMVGGKVCGRMHIRVSPRVSHHPRSTKTCKRS